MESSLLPHELRTIRFLRASIPMLNHVAADKIILGATAGAATIWALIADVDLAKWSAGIGIMCVAIGGGITSLMQKWSQTRIQIAKEEAAAAIEIKRQQAQFDQENSGSVLSELQSLTSRFEDTNKQLGESRENNARLAKAVDAMQSTMETMQGRVKDANDKLHAMRTQAQQDSFKHTEEIQQLKDQHSKEIGQVHSQLNAVTAALQAANAELKIANAKIQSVLTENASLRKMAEKFEATAAKNSQAIEETNAKVDQLAGPAPATGGGPS